MAGEREALAAAKIFPNVPVTPVIRHTVWLGPGWHTIQTTNSTGTSPDTVLHVADFMGSQVAYNDDAVGLDSLVNFSVPWSAVGTHTVLVYAWSPAGAGNTDLYVDGVRVLTAARFEGRKLTVDPGPYVYRAATRPAPDLAFPMDPYVYAFSAGTTWVGADDDNGTGHLFSLDGHLLGVNRLVVGDYTPAAAVGAIDVYQNDVDNDADGDGLGLDLETLLLTCDRATQPGCGGPEWCAEIDNPASDPDHAFRLNRCFADSDRDGIDDGLEVFGHEDSTYPGESVHFPGMGANPIRKDIFVEVDRDPAFLSVPPVTESDVMTVVNHYWAASTAVAHQRAGAGFAIHMDIGWPCYTYPQYCGYWGGSNNTPTSPPAQACDTPGVPGLASQDGSFRPIRRPYFRYAAIKRTPAAGGGVALDIPGRCLNWDGAVDDRSMATFTHELGHSLGLEHVGHISWGSAHCKPHYTSLMNYSGMWPEFSLGTRVEVLNPASIQEAGAYATLMAQNPASYLQRTAPGYGASFNFGFDSATGSVDWDRFGGSSATAIRASPTQPWNDFDGCCSLASGCRCTRTRRSGQRRQYEISPQRPERGH